jgi:hypothetical protein
VQASSVERHDPESPAPTRPDSADVKAGAAAGDASPQRFRALLHARKPRAEGAAEALAGEGLGFQRLAAERLPHELVSRPAPVAAPDARLLVGQGAVGREARVEFRSGPLAGASVHLVSGAAGLEVRLAAPSELARQTLAGVIDRARLHLRSRGIVVRPGASVDIGSRQRHNDGREKR